MTLFDDPLWPLLAPYVSLGVAHTEPTWNLDISSRMPDALRKRVLAIRVPCVSCGKLIAPIRDRSQSSQSRIAGTKLAVNLFYSATCPDEKGTKGCCRTKVAKAHQKTLPSRGVRQSGRAGVVAPGSTLRLAAAAQIRRIISDAQRTRPRWKPALATLEILRWLERP